jgi:flagellin
MMSVLTNLASLNAQRANRGATESLSNSFRKLASGYRVETAADDSAGLAVSENLKSRAMSQRVAMRNTNDGVGLAQTAEGAMNEIADMMKRMRELAVQSSSETLAATERAYVNDEFVQMQGELGRIRDVTNFNGINLLDGSISAGLSVQVGADQSADNRIAIAIGDVTKVVTISGGGGGGGSATTTGTMIDASSALSGKLGPTGSTLTNIPALKPDGISDAAFESKSAIARAAAINSGTSTHGVTATANAAVYTAGLAIKAGPANSTDELMFHGGPHGMGFPGIEVIDLTYNPDTGASDLSWTAGDTDNTLKASIQSQLDGHWSGIYEVDNTGGKLSITATDGRSFSFTATSPSPTQELGIGKFGGQAHGTLTLTSAVDFDHDFKGADWGFGPGSTTIAAGGGGGGGITTTSDITLAADASVDSVANARAAITTLDSHLDHINSQRSTLGAAENRLASAFNNLSTDTENLLSAASHIKDADFAFETAEMSKHQIMQQSSTSILSQANGLTQSVLRLI